MINYLDLTINQKNLYNIAYKLYDLGYYNIYDLEKFLTANHLLLF